MYQIFKSRVDPRRFHDALYSGAIGLFDDLAEMRAIVAFTQEFLADRFAPHHPPDINRHVAPADLPEVLAAAQRDYARMEQSKALWRMLFEAIGLDAMGLARDRLVLRFQPPLAVTGGKWTRSTATVGFHRDTWGTNLYAQVNWWAPVYPLSVERTVAFFPSLWDVPLPNDSESFDMAEAMRRVREAPPDLRASDILPQLRGAIDPAAARPVTIEPGTVLAFSAQHAHAGVPNHTDGTRISLDTRTLWMDDFIARRGAPNVDGRARWMAPGMFQRVSDGVPLSTLLEVDKLQPYEGPWPPETPGA